MRTPEAGATVSLTLKGMRVQQLMRSGARTANSGMKGQQIQGEIKKLVDRALVFARELVEMV